MKRLLVSILLAAACSSGPKSKPVNEPATGATAAQTPPSPANPPGPATTGTPSPAPPAAGQPATPTAPAASGSAAAQAKPEPPLLDESAMDKSVDPCTDFYQYACGSWLKKTPIPEDRALWGRGFSEILQRNEALLRDILEKDARGEADPSDPYAQKVGDFYSTCMDEHKAETASLQTLQDALRKIDAVKDGRGLARQVADSQASGARAFFGFGSQQDFKDATQVIGGADQGGLGLPDRDYYLKDDARMKDLRALYQDHVAKMLELAGEQEGAAKKQAQVVMNIETALAKDSMDKVERRDPNKIYHRLDRAGLKKTAPHFLWDAYFDELGAPGVQQINVLVPEFFAGMDKLIAQKGKLNDLKTYLRWKTLEASANTLGKGFVEERFRLTKALTGAKAILPRWKRCVQMTDRALGEALGRTFVTTTIGDEGKQIAETMVQGIEGAFDRNLAQVDWMDDAARAASKDKLKKINNKIGYPEKWRDYSKMNVGKDSLLANFAEAARFETRRDLDKIGKPVDRNEWQMSPPTVNAYYDPSMNEMVFPAGIMQSPFFKTDAPQPGNYGGLGMVMGHELTHGFDDEGRQFDGDGNLHEWWSKPVNDAFKERAECVARQYDGYTAVEDLKLNGHLTLGENIADIGGLKLALAALRQKRGGSLQPNTEQGFFVAFAQTWCTNYRPEAARLQAQTNPHSTAQWRVNGPVSDNPEFAKAFSCKAGAPMAPQNRCVVW
ncbi:MAG TPA: M13 family metallopeptidase [Myxococcales bacterium]|nr:M13 family metallopeptidase [Myxococcales bacterium]